MCKPHISPKTENAWLPDGAMSKVFVEILWEEWMSSAIMDEEKRSKKPKLGGVLDLVPVLENHQNVMD